MWLLDWLLGRKRLDVAELARRLDVTPESLQSLEPRYREFSIPKRSGGTRLISSPEPELMAVQRKILHRLLGKLKTHPAAKGFERGESIVTHARLHTGRDVVVKMDIKDFFPSTSAERVDRYFRKIGWNREAAALLTRLCTWNGGLPQGAPTSPRLSNLVNYRMDARLAVLARRHEAVYSRYADDLTFSTNEAPTDAQARRSRRPRRRANFLVHAAKQIVAEQGYELHTHKKLQIRRRNQQQRVTGLVVNEKVALPRATRRWLRAVEHHEATGRETTLTPEQLQGWRAFRHMVETQRESAER